MTTYVLLWGRQYTYLETIHYNTLKIYQKSNRRTDETMTKRKGIKGQTVIHKTLKIQD